jgi:hypothetical protein
MTKQTSKKRSYSHVAQNKIMQLVETGTVEQFVEWRSSQPNKHHDALLELYLAHREMRAQIRDFQRATRLSTN